LRTRAAGGFCGLVAAFPDHRRQTATAWDGKRAGEAGAVEQAPAKEIEVQQLRTKIQSEVQSQVQQSQRDYYLREQLKGHPEGTGRAGRGAAGD